MAKGMGMIIVYFSTFQSKRCGWYSEWTITENRKEILLMCNQYSYRRMFSNETLPVSQPRKRSCPNDCGCCLIFNFCIILQALAVQLLYAA